MANEKWQVEWVPLNSIKLDPKNRNKHPKDQIERLAKLMAHYGWVGNPIVVSTTSKICKAGEGRYLAAKQVGLTEVPVHFKTFANEDDEYGWGIEDNGISKWAELDFAGINEDIANLGPDFDIDLLGLKDFTVDIADKQGESDPDEVPEPKPAIVKRGEIYVLGSHRLMCGDSTSQEDVAALMAGEKADLVFTDPPYGVNYDGGHATDKRREKLANDDSTLIYDGSVPNMVSFSKDKAALYLWFADATKSLQVLQVLQANDYEIRSWLIWNKNMAQFGAIGAQYKQKHEPCLYCFKKGYAPFWDGPTNEVSVWDEKRASVNEFHPTQKPIELAARAIGNSCPKGGSVLDLFGGSGSTLVAAEKTNRTCFTMELDPVYCGVILDRWAKFTGLDPHREDGTAWSEIKANLVS